MSDIERLLEKKRGKGRLDPAKPRQPIPAERVSALPGAAPTNSGFASPFDQQAFTGNIYHTLTSSDGLMVVTFGESITYLDASGKEMKFDGINPDA